MSGESKFRRPGDSPDFFTLPPPEGRSRESTIVLDEFGRFSHEGERIEHDKLERALHSWIARNPDDGRYILSNGYDWTYFTVAGVPLFVRGASAESLTLLGDLAVPWSAVRKLAEDGDDLYAEIEVPGKGLFIARFLQTARLALAPLLAVEGDSLGIRAGGEWHPIGAGFSRDSKAFVS